MNLFMHVSSPTVDKRITWYFMTSLVTTPTSYCFVEWDPSIINYPKNKFWYNTQINSFQAYCSDLMSAELNWHLGCKFSGDVLVCSFVQCASASSDNAVVWVEETASSGGMLHFVFGGHYTVLVDLIAQTLFLESSENWRSVALFICIWHNPALTFITTWHLDHFSGRNKRTHGIYYAYYWSIKASPRLRVGIGLQVMHSLEKFESCCSFCLP